MVVPITLDGRQFHGFASQGLAANQDVYILAHLRLARAVALDGMIQRTKEQRAEELLFTQILLSGRTHHILAGCLTEEGKVWNRMEADANAVRFAAITDVEEKKAMCDCIVRLVVGFCLLGEKEKVDA